MPSRGWTRTEPSARYHISHIHVIICISYLHMIDNYILQLALKAGVFYDKVSNMTILGNHSTTQVCLSLLYCHLLFLYILGCLSYLLEVNQVPDFLNARINGRPVKEVITDHKWLEEGFTESVQKVTWRFL